MATFTQDDYKTRSVDVVHINPSLLEGEVNYTSIIGADRAVRLDRFAPILLVTPSISGPDTIPGILSCFPGVWDGSPTPSYTYQWYSDGVILEDETESTLLTDVSMADTEITCVVSASNTSGSENATSNGITVSIIEPIRIEEHNHYAITGLNQTERNNMMVFRGAVITGISHEDRFDTMGMTVLPITGMWREGRFDTMSHTALITTGLGSTDADMVQQAEAYAIQFARLDKSLPVVNPSASTGDITGWTQDPNYPSGTLTVDSTLGNGDSFSFQGSQNSTFETQYYQDVPIDSADYADVDNGDTAVYLHYYDIRTQNYDYCHMYYEALDEFDLVLETFQVEGENLQPTNGTWEHRISGVQDLPAGTRSIRIYMNFSNQIISGITTRIDDITLDLYKYVIVT